MSDLLSTDQLPIALLLIIPGFISLKVFSLIIPGRSGSAADSVLEALTYGVLNAAIWFWPVTIWIAPLASERPWLFTVGMLAVMVLSPAVLAVLVAAVLTSQRMRRLLPHPTPAAWDFFFGKQQPAWIRVKRSDGTMIGGLYGADSFTSSYPSDRDLYIEEQWLLDENGKFLAPVDETKGLWVSMCDGDVLELYRWESGVEGGQR